VYIQNITKMSETKDKNGEPINEGDHVFARSRGGRHEGEVEKIVTSKEEAEKEGVKHPPKVRSLTSSSTESLQMGFLHTNDCGKVLFTDQHGHHVQHNPGTLQHGEYKK
jgi:hypothetical protein